MIVVCVRAACYFVYIVVAVITNISGIVTIQVCIILRTHIPAAAPVLIANSEKLQFPRLLLSVLLAQVRHRGLAVKRHVFDPLLHFPDSTAAYVAANIWFSIKKLA
ncbi:hypothetical protein D3C81_1478150 [compost metagenome]